MHLSFIGTQDGSSAGASLESRCRDTDSSKARSLLWSVDTSDPESELESSLDELEGSICGMFVFDALCATELDGTGSSSLESRTKLAADPGDMIELCPKGCSFFDMCTTISLKLNSFQSMSTLQITLAVACKVYRDEARPLICKAAQLKKGNEHH